jgi:hypothetical protein
METIVEEPNQDNLEFAWKAIAKTMMARKAYRRYFQLLYHEAYTLKLCDCSTARQCRIRPA